MRTLKRFVAGLAVVTVGLWSGSTVAHAATTEFRVVSTFMYQDAADEIVQRRQWLVGVRRGDRQGRDRLRVRRRRTAWGARPSCSTPPQSATAPPSMPCPTQSGTTLAPSRGDHDHPGPSPRVLAVPVQRVHPGIDPRPGGLGRQVQSNHVIITFDPSVNGYTAVDTWMYVDTTADGGRWTVAFRLSDDNPGYDPDVAADVMTYTAIDFNGTHQWWACSTTVCSSASRRPGPVRSTGSPSAPSPDRP